MKDLLETAKTAAIAAGRVHEKYFEKALEIGEKSGSNDLVTNADLESEAKIVSVIRDVFPGHNILGEEENYEKTDSEYTWIVDPLDGTNNFASGIPIFCSSVAVALHGDVVAGAIYDVTRDELFYAGKGQGAFLNGNEINVGTAESLTKSIIATGFFYDRGSDMRDTLRNIEKFFMANVRGVRRLGAAAIDLAYVASGRFSGFWEFSLQPWDFAAGKLIVEEAGGRVTGAHGEVLPLEKHFVVASNKQIHKDMLNILKPKS
jgi:myo-inositol-1(or 4)-monophosphatase